MSVGGGGRGITRIPQRGGAGRDDNPQQQTAEGGSSSWGFFFTGLFLGGGLGVVGTVGAKMLGIW
jgi:hypothetical protein